MTNDQSVWEETPQVIEPVYRINERPKHLWESLLYGWQHTLVDISPFVLPILLAGAIGLSSSQSAAFINFCLFTMGIATLIQTTIGNRLPLIQGPSATLTGTLISLAKQTNLATIWTGVFLGAIAEMLIGASRILKYLRKFFPLAVSGVVIISIGISLGKLAIRLVIGNGTPALPFQAINFVFAATVIALIFFLQLRCQKIWGGILSRGAIFFSIWIVGLGMGSLLGAVKWSLVAEKSLFAMPQFLPFGSWNLTFNQETLAIFFAIFVGYLGSMVESLGDYAATCTVAGEKFQVHHMNRGIFAEGLSCAIAPLFGGLPCTSYTQNIGIIATTKVASRFVVQIAALILMLYGLCPKFGALLVAMPSAVLGGVFIIVCAMIILSGIRLLAATNNTTANAFLIGTSLLLAIGVPHYMEIIATTEIGKEWLNSLPMLIELLFTNTVVMAVVSGITLNIVLNMLLSVEE